MLASTSWRRLLDRVLRPFRSRKGRLVLGAVVGTITLTCAGLAAREFAGAPWPLTHGQPGLLAAVGALFLVGAAFKACGWRQLFAAHERPRPVALAVANGGASVMGLVLPGRFDDVIRVALVRRSSACPAGVRAICLSLFMLGLIDAVAVAPLAAVAAGVLGGASSVRAGLAFVALAGIGASVLVVALPRLARRRQLLRFRLGRWLSPRATSVRTALRAWALVSVAWVVRAVALFLLLGTIGIGFSLPLALLFLCATAAGAVLPVGPAGAATQAGAGAAVLVAAGVGASQAVAAAVAAQALGVLAGGSIVLLAAAWRVAVGLRWRRLTRIGLPPRGLYGQGGAV